MTKKTDFIQPKAVLTVIGLAFAVLLSLKTPVLADTVLTPHVLSDGSKTDLGSEKIYHFDSNGQDLLRLDVPQDGAVKIRLAAEKSDSVIAEIYQDANASGLPHYLKTDCRPDLWSTGSLMEYFTKGTYYIRLPRNNYTIGLSEYPVRGTELKNGSSAIGYCDYEHKNTYTFKAPGNGYVMVSKTGMENTPGTMTAVLCNSKGKTLTEQSLFTHQQKNSVCYAVKKGTTYKLKIGALNVSDTQYYQLGLKYKAVSEKSGSTKKKAVTIKFGNKVSGTVCAEDSASAADWYMVKNTKKQELLLNYSGNISSGSMVIDIYDTKGKKLDSYTVLANIGESNEALLHNSKNGTQMPTGTYYIRIRKSSKTASGTYSFNLSGK